MKKILIIGASSDIGISLIKKLSPQNYQIGAHCFKGKKILEKVLKKSSNRYKIFVKNLSSQASCNKLVQEYIKWSKGVDGLVQLNGNISKLKLWNKLNEKNWNKDFLVNLSTPFFITQKIFEKMKKKGGKIILMSTASAKFGGGKNTIAYGIAKSGVQSLTKFLAREGGKFKILVNCVAPGLILTKFHKDKLKRSRKDLLKRKKMNKLNEFGSPEEIAFLISNLLSNETKFITGEILKIDGGDWI